ncbi:hypothetical protein EXIGLDRAFT_255565 [Exidia glandulosa HHB12029]|uniref:Uncharacterized protein n=1 Tax=Exidia glandulosa HHB12029 TaxID=1314781 RepID=A0A165ZSH2_EXIGL|nr:hypothetical protein EXIGLDRAFT_255565 [Exidia glandulosa HHB12029]
MVALRYDQYRPDPFPWHAVVIAGVLAVVFLALGIYLLVIYRRRRQRAQRQAAEWEHEQMQWAMTQASPQPIVILTAPTPSTEAVTLPPTALSHPRSTSDAQRDLAEVLRSAPPQPQWGTRPPPPARRRGRESWRFVKGVAGPSSRAP